MSKRIKIAIGVNWLAALFNVGAAIGNALAGHQSMQAFNMGCAAVSVVAGGVVFRAWRERAP